MEFKYTDLSKYADYQGQWIALDGAGASERIVGHAKALADARAQAENRGCAYPTFFKVPYLGRSYCLTPFTVSAK